MGLFSFLMPREKDNRINHDLDDEDRAFSLKTRQARAALKDRQLELEAANMELKSELERTRIEMQLEQTKQQLDELRGIDEDIPEDNNIDKMLMLLLSQIIQKSNNPVSVPSINQPQAITGISKEQIQEFWDKLPKAQQKIIKKMDNTTLANTIHSYLPKLMDIDILSIEEFVKAQK